jgi:hypothetical protein
MGEKGGGVLIKLKSGRGLGEVGNGWRLIKMVGRWRSK